MPAKHTPHVPLDQRDPSTVRSVVLARVSDHGARDITVESQIDACNAFIATMGWPKPVIGPYSDKRSGIYNEQRDGLEAVEEHLRRREVDVVVVLNWDRLARVEERRHAAMYLAKRYGAEYCFAELEPDGKRPDTLEAKIIASVMEVVGEITRQQILANTRRGRLKRALQGIPIGGRGGAPYGFRYAKEGEEFSVWMPDEVEAPRLLWMFEQMANDERMSVRRLAIELNERGWRTREGKDWSPSSVRDKIRNPVYCGKATLNHWKVTHEPKPNADGLIYDQRVLHKRTEEDENSFLPIKEGTMPILIDPDLFQRANDMHEKRKNLHRKLADDRPASPHPADATLFDGEFIKCADCHKNMTRWWSQPRKRTHPEGVVHYRDSSSGPTPSTACKLHVIPAAAVDELALRLLSFAITDPEKMIALADASQKRYAKAVAAGEIAAVHLEGYAARIEEIDVEIQRLDRKLKLSDPNNPDDAEDIDRYRERIAKLKLEKVTIEEEIALLVPKRDRALDRQSFLRRLIEVPELLFDFANNTVTETGRTCLAMDDTLLVRQAAQLLGVDEVDVGELVPVTQDELFFNEDAEARNSTLPTAGRADVLYTLLKRQSREHKHKLFRHLGATVEISRPWPRAEQAWRGKTPVEERVTLCIGALRLRWPATSSNAKKENVTNFSAGLSLVQPRSSQISAR